MSSNKLNLSEIPAQQIAELQKQLNEEVQRLNLSLETLLALIEKFDTNIQTIKDVTQPRFVEESENNEMLIPVTNTLFITGKKSVEKKNKDRFVVDIGTGYYIEKNGKEAIEYYNRKINTLKMNYKKISDIIQERANTMKVLQDELERKVGGAGSVSQLANKDGVLLK